jgi:hypothetical protein
MIEDSLFEKQLIHVWPLELKMWNEPCFSKRLFHDCWHRSLKKTVSIWCLICFNVLKLKKTC